MPAVHVEPCFITNPRAEALLRTERFRQDVASAVTWAIERFFLPDPAEARRDEAGGTPVGSAQRSAGSSRSASRSGAKGR